MDANFRQSRICLLCSIHNITIVVRHFPGVKNSSADALCRSQFHLFFSFNSQASRIPKVVLKALQDLVFNHHIHSASSNWTELLRATLEVESLHTAYMYIYLSAEVVRGVLAALQH